MSAHVWTTGATRPTGDPVEDTRVGAKNDLEDWAEDYAEFLRLDDLLENPPMGRIPDDTVWFPRVFRQWKPIRDRWGIR